jgi:hypothetical protein
VRQLLLPPVGLLLFYKETSLFPYYHRVFMTFNKILSVTTVLGIASGMACMQAATPGVASEPSPADRPNIVSDLENRDNVTIDQPVALTARLAWDSIAAKPQTDSKVTKPTASRNTGFRVEVFSDNNPRTAKATASIKKRNLEARFKNYPVYMVFESPFWRVRLGDFKTRGEAEGAMQEIRSAFPSYAKDLRIVKSNITNN